MKNSTEIFPLLRELIITSHNQRFILEYFLEHFPHLEYVDLSVCSKETYFEIEYYGQFIGLNPQIRYLHMRDISRIYFLQVTSEKLPNLEILKITISPNLHFSGSTANNSTRFERLKELHILGDNHWIDNWSWPHFIAQNKKLQILDTNRLILESSEWMMIVDSLPNLVEVRTEWNRIDCLDVKKNKSQKGHVRT